MYSIADDLMVAVVSDRISAFDVILPKPIPFKGQVLNGIASYFLDAVSDIVPTWKVDTPHPQVTIGHACEPIRLEMVIRGYLTGHAWRTYKSGKRVLCGVALPEGMKEHDRFPEPIITPATKAEEGHDEDVSKEDILKRNIVSPELYSELERVTRALFQRGTEMAREQGLILVDTKYEFGLRDGKLFLIDEIHTPDSSRYFIAEGYQERQDRGEQQKQLSKEFVREWLMANDFMGLEGQTVPDMPDSFINEVTDRYIGLYEQVTGQPFERTASEHLERDIEVAVADWIAANAHG
jgi:phosphoribosylaminoimidazole-succinocarboxamide synthase